MTSDETAGSVEFKTKDLIDNVDDINGKFMWMNIYGSPLGISDSKYKKDMNEQPDTASNWKGRVLVQTIVELCEKPK